MTGSDHRAPRWRLSARRIGFARSGGGQRPRRNGGDVQEGRLL